ncbi:segregation/condensation protein A [Fodinisporobacter ferrooxydans]|uniref:Segregation and condensation protein A n=1 Tax=Fodinisporobacter ferrooxydans TaxID=2901836 RepID=A0ABY4CH85_9BACL|nr:segregation/condensation protein A [Alicyclobacillaceae bacterium MYW30-H2]
MEYQLHLDAFAGPLDLLLHLIEKNELDIHDIPIAQVTEQYLQYLRAMQELQLDVASEFLVMAATLLEIKSSILLPRPAPASFELSLDLDMEDYDPRTELMERILEYKKYKYLAQHLKEREVHRSHIFSRTPEDLTVFAQANDSNPVTNVTLFDLLSAFQKALDQISFEEPHVEMERDEISLTERMFEIRMVLQQARSVRFSELFADAKRRTQVVVTFLALLELMKNKHVVCVQQRLFDDIEIQAVN